jgi:hypothetical protein
VTKLLREELGASAALVTDDSGCHFFRPGVGGCQSIDEVRREFQEEH